MHFILEFARGISMRKTNFLFASIVMLLMACQAMAGERMPDDEWVDNAISAFSKPKPIAPKYSYDVTAYSNCVLENSSKAQQTPIQANRIAQACRTKATPRKCRNVSVNPPDNNSKSPQETCVEACNSEGMWSRKFGDCSLDQ